MVRSRFSSQQRSTSSRTTLVVTVVSLGLHVLAWRGVEAMGGLSGSRAGALSETTPAEAMASRARAPTPSCEGDELLASAARMLVCAMPAGGGAGCVRDTADAFVIARHRCDRVEIPAAVTLLDPRVLAEIEPEPLMDLIDPAVLAQIQEAQKAPQEETPPPAVAAAPPPQPQPQLDMQTVEIAPQENQEPPANTRFLADRDSAVEKQTVARGSTAEMVARPEPSPHDTKEIPQPSRAEPDRDTAGQAVEAEQGPGRFSMREPGQPEPGQEVKPEVTPGLRDGSDATPAANGLQVRRGTGDRYQKAQEAMDPRRGGESGGGGSGRTLPNLRPTEDVLERPRGGGSVDHLEDVEEGESTALNAKQWKYASFFNRTKRQVAQNWNPNRVLQSEDPRGNVYGVRDRITVLRVTLDAGGHLVDVIVTRSSGFDSLDDEAIRAFRAAEPFPNPPPDLVEPRSQRISFQFGFHLDNAERSSWKLFR